VFHQTCHSVSLPDKLKNSYCFMYFIHTLRKEHVSKRFYYDYQLSKARGKFGYEVLASKLWCCHGQLTSFSLVAISTAVGRLSRRLQFRALCCQLTSKADKLPMDTEPVARDNNAIFTLKLGHQTFAPPYSTDNRSKGPIQTTPE